METRSVIVFIFKVQPMNIFGERPGLSLPHRYNMGFNVKAISNFILI